MTNSSKRTWADIERLSEINDQLTIIRNEPGRWPYEEIEKLKNERDELVKKLSPMMRDEQEKP
jgi:hypothetical protein